MPAPTFNFPGLQTLLEKYREKAAARLEKKLRDMRGIAEGDPLVDQTAWLEELAPRLQEGSGRIVGAQMVGHSGEELIHLFALAMRHGITAADLKSSVFAFPTFAADVKSMV